MDGDKIKTETNGNVLFPIHRLLIRNQDNKILKNYYKEGCYIVDCNIVDNQIALKRIQMSEEGDYRYIADDHIASSDIQDKNVTKINTINHDVYKKTVQLILKNTINPNSMRIQTSREVIFEGGRDISLELENAKNQFYVYGPKGVDEITSSSAYAVEQAFELSGSVVDAEGNYVWKKGTVYPRNQIMAITGTKRDGENSSLAVCLDTILELEGISRKTQPLLDAGEDALSILKNSLRKEIVLDIRGCPVDTVLYYVDQDIPVLALMDNGDVYLIIGFNEFNIVLMDPKLGTVYKKGMNDSREMFEKNGNQFITYMRSE